MIKGNNINNGLLKALLMACFTLILLSGCIPNQAYTPVTKTKKTGIHNVNGWSYSNCYFHDRNAIGSCNSKDIDGKVGYQLYVDGLRANCGPDNKWHTSKKILTGTLPPGLAFVSGGSNIKGIPEKRGHWIVTIKVDNLYCQGKSYYGLKQELRFHITGSGKVRY